MFVCMFAYIIANSTNPQTWSVSTTPGFSFYWGVLEVFLARSETMSIQLSWLSSGGKNKHQTKLKKKKQKNFSQEKIRLNQ